MLNLKKTALAVLALGSSAVFAGSMGPVCSSVNVTVPCEKTAWDFGAKALYLKPALNTDGGLSRSDLLNGTAIDDITTAHAPNYGWGFELEGSYHFNTGNDLNINWYHYNKSTSQTFGSTPEAIVFGSTTNDILTVAGRGGSSSIDPKWDAVNFEFGQHSEFGNGKNIRFHGGAQYARVANSVFKNSGVLATSTVIDGTFTSTTGVSSSSSTTYAPTFNGFGPRIGMDMSYGWDNGLAIYANGATGILAGTRAFSVSYSNNLGQSARTSVSNTAVVPVIDAKLGATYTYAMAQGDVTLDAGWMFVNYFNAHSNLASDTHDFSLQGPFAGLKWVGNIA